MSTLYVNVNVNVVSTCTFYTISIRGSPRNIQVPIPTRYNIYIYALKKNKMKCQIELWHYFRANIFRPFFIVVQFSCAMCGERRIVIHYQRIYYCIAVYALCVCGMFAYRYHFHRSFYRWYMLNDNKICVVVSVCVRGNTSGVLG